MCPLGRERRARVRIIESEGERAAPPQSVCQSVCIYNAVPRICPVQAPCASHVRSLPRSRASFLQVHSFHCIHCFSPSSIVLDPLATTATGDTAICTSSDPNGLRACRAAGKTPLPPQRLQDMNGAVSSGLPGDWPRLPWSLCHTPHSTRCLLASSHTGTLNQPSIVFVPHCHC